MSIVKFRRRKCLKNRKERGYDEGTYVKETDRYNNLRGALQCLIQDANFELPAQLELELL